MSREHKEKNCIYKITRECGNFYGGDTARLLNVRIRKHHRNTTQRETEKLGAGAVRINLDTSS